MLLNFFRKEGVAFLQFQSKSMLGSFIGRGADSFANEFRSELGIESMGID